MDPAPRPGIVLLWQPGEQVFAPVPRGVLHGLLGATSQIKLDAANRAMAATGPRTVGPGSGHDHPGTANRAMAAVGSALARAAPRRY